MIVMRHGQTFQSTEGLFAGLADDPLSPAGEHQAATWSSVFRELGSFSVFLSPLQRAVQTAALAGLGEGLVLQDLREWDLGSLEGVNANSYRASHPDWNLFADGAPGGETTTAVVERAVRVIDQIGLETQPGTVSVVVSHGQFIRALAMSFLGLPLAAASSFSVGPARAAIFTQRRGDRYLLTGWNVSADVHSGGLLNALT